MRSLHLIILASFHSQLSSAFLSKTTGSFLPATGTCLYDTPEPLAEEGSWQAFLDEEKTGLVYYFDTKTGESLWEPPTSTFPAVRLPRRKQRLADNLRSEYRKARQLETMGGGEDANERSAGATTAVEVEESQEEEQEQQQAPSWIKGIFDSEKESKESIESAESVIVEEEEEEARPKKDWFKFFDDSGKRNDEEITVSEPEIEEPEQAEQKRWFRGVFGRTSSAIEDTPTKTEGKADGETVVQREENYFEMIESWTSPSSSQQGVSGSQVKEKEKIIDTTPKPIKIEMGSHVLPHPAKVRWGGEDAVFAKGRTFGVFDGVSGADKLDGVPLYSRTLANEMKKMVGNSGITVQDMTTYLTSAAAYADGAATGASTAVVASIGENGFLQALNVGDSYCLVIRDGKITAKTREISHYWECPYQLSEDSPDRPRDGTKLNVELISGDIVVMGSDGVFDNVNDDMLLDLVEKSPTKASALAKKICDLSRKQSLDRNSSTPYAKQAQRRGDPDYKSGLGGKVDDVSCVVVICK